MAEQRSFRKELLKSLDDIENINRLLNDIYADPKQSTPANKPVIQMLVHACDYLSSNLTILKDRLAT